MTVGDIKKNLEDVINKLQEAQESVVKWHEEAKATAPDGTSELSILAQKTAEIVNQGVSKAKEAYEAAGGAVGISEKATVKVAEFSANAKVVYDNATNSNAGKAAFSGISTGATKIAGTKTFQNAKEHALKLRSIATETFEATYETKKSQIGGDAGEDGEIKSEVATDGVND